MIITELKWLKKIVDFVFVCSVCGRSAHHILNWAATAFNIRKVLTFKTVD